MRLSTFLKSLSTLALVLSTTLAAASGHIECRCKKTDALEREAFAIVSAEVVVGTLAIFQECLRFMTKDELSLVETFLTDKSVVIFPEAEDCVCSEDIGNSVFVKYSVASKFPALIHKCGSIQEAQK